MFYYIPQIILFLSIVVIIWVVAKNLKKVDAVIDANDGYSLSNKSPNRFGKKIFNNIVIEKFDDKFNRMIEKILRRIRILIIKIDSFLQKVIESVKKSSKPKSIFKTGESIDFISDLDNDDEGEEEYDDREDDEKEKEENDDKDEGDNENDEEEKIDYNEEEEDDNDKVEYENENKGEDGDKREEKIEVKKIKVRIRRIKKER